MSLTPETLTRHELVGLHVEVVESTDPSRVGIAGRIVRETMNTIVIDVGGDGEDSGVRQVPKRGTVFEFELTDESAATREGAGTASEPVSGESHTAGYGVAYVTVDGVELLSRPALRSENGVDSKWQ